jgi:hypothetical protein
LLPPQILKLLLGRSPGDVSGHQIVNQAHVFTAAALGFANPLRIGAQDQGVNHGLTVPAPVSQSVTLVTVFIFVWHTPCSLQIY